MAMNMGSEMAGREVDAMGRVGGPKKSKVEFTPPDGLELDGESGESLVTWKKEGDKVCIVSMDGVSLDVSSETEDKAETDAPEEEMD